MIEKMNDQRQRLLALSTSYPLRESSSSGIFVHRLYSALLPWWNVDVVCPDDTLDSINELDGVKVHPARYAFKRWQLLSGSGGVLPSLRRKPFAFLLLPLLLSSLFLNGLFRSRHAQAIHGNWSVCGLLAIILGRMTGKPVLVTLRGSDVEKARGGILFRWLLDSVVTQANAVVCVSKAMCLDLQAQYPKYADKICHSPNGVSDAFFNNRHTPRIQGQAIRLLAVGSLLPVKGFDILISALAKMMAEADIELVIVGEGPERDRLQTCLQAFGLSKNIRLMGLISPNQMPECYANADVFVLSSRNEGRPNVLAEAVASGLPVLCADLPGVVDLVRDGENGWLFKPDDVEALASGIRRCLLDMPQWLAMGHRGKMHLQACSSWAVTADQYHKLLCSMLKEQRE